LDPVLRAGTFRSRNNIPVANGGQPLAFPGGFAKVYIVDSGGKTYALRVWLVEIADAAERYQVTSAFLRNKPLPFFVDFKLISNGILVEGRKYPILRMEWVHGRSLRDFISKHLHQPEIIKAAAEVFYSMVKALHQARVSHGDLQADNMILRVDGARVHCHLIDYDTLTVPALVGRPINSTGLPSYQHPRRAATRSATEKDDFFPELVIYLCLVAIVERPSLWTKFPGGGRDKELLFEPADYTATQPTPLFRELYGMGGVVQKLAVVLWNFSRCQSIASLVPLEEVVDLARPANSIAPVAAATRPASAFDQYLKSRLSARQFIGGRGWLDDTAFYAASRPSPSPPPSTPELTRLAAVGGPSFAEVLAGKKLADEQPPPPPAPVPQPKSINLTHVVIGIALLVLVLLIIRETSKDRTSSWETPQPSSLTPVASSTSAPWQSTVETTPTETVSDSPATRDDATWDAPIQPTPAVITYRVVKVDSNDRLNLREGPGINYSVVANISPYARGIVLGEHRFSNGDTIWQEILIEEFRGYVNEIYLEPEP
jgi:serine/threonine protein kinase